MVAAATSTLVMLPGSALLRGRRQGREDVLWAAFVGTFVGVGIGLCLYVISLIIELAAALH